MTFRFMSNEAICKELGSRLQNYRLSMNLTQAQLAENCALPKRSVERIENGENKSLVNLLFVLRAMNLLDNISLLVPEQELRPTDIVMNKKQKVRVCHKKNAQDEKPKIKWGDEK